MHWYSRLSPSASPVSARKGSPGFVTTDPVAKPLYRPRNPSRRASAPVGVYATPNVAEEATRVSLLVTVCILVVLIVFVGALTGTIDPLFSSPATGAPSVGHDETPPGAGPPPRPASIAR